MFDQNGNWNDRWLPIAIAFVIGMWLFAVPICNFLGDRLHDLIMFVL